MSSAIAKVAAKQARRIAEAASQEDRKARRGPRRLPQGELRDHTVSVRMNHDELTELDRQRHVGGGYLRGEWLRMAWRDQQPETRIPAVNQQAYAALARSAANLNQIARYLNEGGDLRGRMGLIEEELGAFRVALLRAEATKE